MQRHSPIRLVWAAIGLAMCLTVVQGPPSATAAIGAWSSFGPVGGRIADLQVSPSHHATVWAAAGSGLVFKSTDSGRTWVPSRNGMKFGKNVDLLAVSPSDPSIVYAGGYGSTLGSVMYRTSDGGASWSSRKRGLTDIVLALVVHPTDPDTAYASTYSGLYKTTDGGLHWNHVDVGLPLPAYSLLIRPINPDVLFAGTGTGVYRTTNGGGTWSPRGIDDLDAAISSFALDPFDSATLYVGTYGEYVYESVDNGANWTQLATGLSDSFVDEVEVDPTLTRLYGMDRANQIHMLDTSAVTPLWTSVTDTGIESAGVPGTLAVDPVAPSNLYVGSERLGVARSMDRALTWSRSNRGLTATSAIAVTIDQSQSSTVYAGTNGGVYRSTNSGSSRRNRSSGLPAGSVLGLVASPSDPLTIYVALNGPGVYKTIDGGATWTATATTLSAFALVVHPTDPDTAWIGTVSQGVFKTTDGGGQWDLATAGLPDAGGGSFPFIDALAISASDPDVLYLGTYQRVFRSVNGAGSWSEVSSGLETTSTVHGLAVNPVNPDVVYAAIGQDGVYRTTTGGANWGPRGLVGKDVRAVIIDPLHRKRLYAGSSLGGVQRTIDAGATWAPFNVGLGPLSVVSLATSADGSQLYAGTFGGGAFGYRFP